MVGKIAVVPIVLSVAVDVAGGESVRNMSVLRNWRYVEVVAAVRVVVVPRCPQGGGCRCCCCPHFYCRCLCHCLLVDHRGFGVTRVRFAVRDQKAGLRTLRHLTLQRIYMRFDAMRRNCLLQLLLLLLLTFFARRRGHRCASNFRGVTANLGGVTSDFGRVIGSLGRVTCEFLGVTFDF